MPRAKETKPRKPRKRKLIIPGEASWRRLWTGGHYKQKGLPLELFKEIASKPCHYCGSPPRYTNAYGRNYDCYLNGQAISSKPCTLEWWQDQWIYANGVDKMEHREDYSDLTNLVPCCTTCNFMKQRLGHDEFIAQCKKIAAFK